MSDPARPPPLDAVLIDVLGTLVELEAPGPALRAELAERLDVEVTEARAAAAFAAEIEYYLAHQLEGGDRESLDELRTRCANVVAERLAVPGLEGPAVKEPMIAALRFVPFDDAEPALLELRAAGVRVVAASNWDCSLGDYLGATGLDELLDGAVSSAEVGVTKPDARLFEAALERAGATAERAVHVGDSLVGDVEGAAAAGVRPIFLARYGGEAPEGVSTIASLAELPPVLLDH